MDFHCRLTRGRKELGISIRKLCKDLSIPKATYERWETHRFPRHPEMYKKLSGYLKLPLEYLMFGTQVERQKFEALAHLEKFIALINA